VERDIIDVKKIVPKSALDHGHQLVTQAHCERMRVECNTHMLTNELTESMKVIKKAISILVLNSPTIPSDDRDKIIKDLVE
jgi:hypothetical protein